MHGKYNTTWYIVLRLGENAHFERFFAVGFNPLMLSLI